MKGPPKGGLFLCRLDTLSSMNYKFSVPLRLWLLLVCISPLYAQAPLDSFVLTESELPAGCKLVSGEFPVDTQSAIFFSYPDYQKQMLPPLQEKRAQSVACGEAKGTLYYFAYATAADVEKTSKFVKPLMWGGSGPSAAHPQLILTGGNVLVIASFRKTPQPLLDVVSKRISGPQGQSTSNPSPAEPSFEKGAAEFRKRNFSAAEKHFQLALKADPEHFWANFFLGESFFRQEKYTQAVEPFVTAARLDTARKVLSPELRRVLNDQLGMAYGISGDLKSAEAHFKAAIQQDPDYALYRYNLACTYAEMNDLDRTLATLEEALKWKANMVAGESFPDPRTDSSFQRFLRNERFRKLLAHYGY